MTTQTTPNSSEQYETIKLGIDAHAQWYYVSRQVDGATPLHDVEEAFGVNFNDESDAATLGGYLVDRWQEIPAEGTEWRFDKLRFVVQKVEKFRVSQVRVKLDESDST